ncbi:MAG: hypothetical protein EOM19_00380 [Candidatus Moranbacteria bacterium]|nr:hypothetical protein [Candidatus Moranbacteria bacterium]
MMYTMKKESIFKKIKITKRMKHFLLFLGMFVVVGVFSFLALSFSPEEIITWIGEENAYIALFFMALLGGSSVFIPFPYYLFTISFGALGLSPFLLGFVSALGAAVGDVTTYYFARKSRVIISSRMEKFFSRTLEVCTKKHPRLVPIFTFLYASFSPFPDDLIMVPAGLMKYPFKRLIVSLFLGKLVFNTLLAFAGLYGWGFVMNVVG